MCIQYSATGGKGEGKKWMCSFYIVCQPDSIKHIKDCSSMATCYVYMIYCFLFSVQKTQCEDQTDGKVSILWNKNKQKQFPWKFSQYKIDMCGNLTHTHTRPAIKCDMSVRYNDSVNGLNIRIIWMKGSQNDTDIW